MTETQTGSQRAPRVMFVDDDAALAQGLARAISSQGYEVRVVNDSTKALDAAKEFEPDLIVLDVMMPVHDGWQVLAGLRSEPRTAGVFVIMLTAADSDASKGRGFSLGADDYLTKPFSVSELRWRIAAVLRRVRAGAVEETQPSIPVVGSGLKLELVRTSDVCYVEGIRNYTYVHTADNRYLSRLTLGALEERSIEGFRRVHRSFIVNLDHVKACGWVSKSAYRLRLDDTAESEVPVSRSLVAEVQRDLGLRG